MKVITTFLTSDETQQAKKVPSEPGPVTQVQSLHQNLNPVQFVRHFSVSSDRPVHFHLRLVVYASVGVMLALYLRHYRILKIFDKLFQSNFNR